MGFKKSDFKRSDQLWRKEERNDASDFGSACLPSSFAVGDPAFSSLEKAARLGVFASIFIPHSPALDPNKIAGCPHRAPVHTQLSAG